MMANVWLAAEGNIANRGGPPWVLPLAECCAKLGLVPAQFCGDLDHPPHFGDQTKPLALFSDPVAVVIELDQPEGVTPGWKPGYYVLDLSPHEAKKRLGPGLMSD